MKNFKLCTIYKGTKKGHKPSLERDWYVKYYFNGKIYRVKKDINRHHTVFQRNEAATTIAKAYDHLLMNGYNPEGDNLHLRNSKLEELIEWAFEKRSPDWAVKTRSDFRSVKKYFLETCEKKGLKKPQLTRVQMRDVIETMVKQRGLGGHAYLKYKSMIHLLYECLLDWEKVEYNPCSFKAGMKRPKPKAKKLLTIDQRHKIREYLESQNPAFFNFVMFIYFTGIRPVELLHLRVGDIDLKRGEIRLNSEYAKDREDRIVIIPDALKPFIYLAGEPHWFLFGYEFEPEERINPVKRDRATKLWNKLIKEELDIDSNLYWIKHLGLNDRRSRGITPEALILQSGHATYQETLDSYISIDSPKIRKELKENGGEF